MLSCNGMSYMPAVTELSFVVISIRLYMKKMENAGFTR